MARMNEPAPRNPDDARPAWRLRPAMLRQMLWPALLFIFYSLSELLIRGTDSGIQGTAGTLALAYVALVASVIILERRRQPPVPQFWDDGSPYRLTVRRQPTGEILLRSEAESLAGADLRHVAWAGVDLMNVNLEGADLQGADLRAANLRGANLRGANFRGVNLAGARLLSARVAGAIFAGADLRGADFAGRGMDRVLWDHDLREADFRGAVYNVATRWPGSVLPDELGCVLSEEGAECLPLPHAGVGSADEDLPLPAEQTTVRG
jgi:hypothetical protein